MKRLATALLAAGIQWVVCSTAHAGPATFVYTGHLTQISSLDPANPFPDPITDDPSNPTLFDGSFTFESLAPDLIPADPSTGAYFSTGGPFAFRLSLGGLGFSFPGVNIGVLDNYPFPIGDQYQAGHFENPTDDNPTGIQVALQLTDLAGTAFSADTLPHSPPPLAAFTFTSFFFTDTINGNQVEVAGVIDSLRVPEPPSLALLATALWLLVLRRPRARIGPR